MLTLQRLNMDSSWKITAGNYSVLIDPWLMGAEIDGFAWFNKQWHRHKAIAPNDLTSYDAIIVSQPFSDHCHERTLKALKSVPIYAAPNAVKRLKRSIDPQRIKAINGPSQKWLTVGPFRLCVLAAPKQLKASFNALLLAFDSSLLMYFPHGYSLSKQQIDQIHTFGTKALITSFSTFKLPFFLGGAVNPGLKKSKDLAALVQADYLFQTHDEDKYAEGIVKKLAKTYYPSTQELNQTFKGRFIALDMQKRSFNIT